MSIASDARTSSAAPREKVKTTAPISGASFAVAIRKAPRRDNKSWHSQTIGGIRNGPNTFGSLKRSGGARVVIGVKYGPSPKTLK